MKPYKTVLQAAETEYIVQKSRFLCACAPAASAEEALAFLEQKRALYKDASHHCYAYIIGENAGVMRYSDDGEPGGTAGLPIIEVMKRQGVVNAAVVITRYFGGILLGAGGLTRAYARSAALALQAAKVCRMHPTLQYLCEVGYPLWDRVQHALQSLPAQVSNVDFGTSVTFSLRVKQEDDERVWKPLITVTDGSITALPEDELMLPWLEETQGENE